MSCFSETGHNITQRVKILFQIGFVVHASVFLNQTYLEPFFRGACGKNSTDGKVMAQVSQTIEWILHATVLIHSIIVFVGIGFEKPGEGNDA